MSVRPKPSLTEKVAAIFLAQRGRHPVDLLDTVAQDLRTICAGIERDDHADVPPATIRQFLESIEVLEAVIAELRAPANGRAA